jgi:hypothetical protein
MLKVKIRGLRGSRRVTLNKLPARLKRIRITLNGAASSPGGLSRRLSSRLLPVWLSYLLWPRKLRLAGNVVVALAGGRA